MTKYGTLTSILVAFLFPIGTPIFAQTTAGDILELAKNQNVLCEGCSPSTALYFKKDNPEDKYHGLCQAFLIGPKTFMTNHHCVPKKNIGNIDLDTSCQKNVALVFPEVKNQEGKVIYQKEIHRCLKIKSASPLTDVSLYKNKIDELSSHIMSNYDWATFELETPTTRPFLKISYEGLADFELVKVSYVQSTYFQGLKQHKLKQQICHARYDTLILSSFKSKISPLLFLADCDGKRGDSGGAVINQNGEAVGIRQGGVMQSQLSSNKKAFTVATNFACMPYARQQDSMSNICKLEKDTYSKNFEEVRNKIFNFDKDPQFKRQWEEEATIEIQKIRSPFQWQFEFQKNTTEANSEAESGVINNVTLKPQCLRREIETKGVVDLLLPAWEMGWTSDSDFIMNNYRKKSFQKTLIKIKRENKKIKIINKNMEFEIPYCESL